jgi:prepilin-type N-terminal cleavage/methylation domain-containing protein
VRDQLNRWRRRLQREDSGVTLVEVLITMMIFSVLMSFVYGLLITIQKQTRDIEKRADSVESARNALEQIDRQVRSGNVLYDPALETLPLSMRVYTQANGEERCVQWQVTGGVLRSRSWSPTWQTDGLVSDWHTVARNILNTTASPPFALQGGTTAYSSRLVDVSFKVKNASAGGRVLDVKTSLSGRNTVYGYDPGICSPVPAA